MAVCFSQRASIKETDQLVLYRETGYLLWESYTEHIKYTVGATVQNTDSFLVLNLVVHAVTTGCKVCQHVSYFVKYMDVY